jgi:hypothetical protein
MCLAGGLLVGCASAPTPIESDAGPSDAGPTDAGALVAPEAPRIPWLDEGEPPIAATSPPLLTPCPPGWREVSGEVAVCDPWPETGRAVCASHEAHFPGSSDCTSVGSACPVDGWPTTAPADAVFVRAGASGGDGTRSAPHGTLGAALAGAPDGTTLAVAPGSYAEAITVPAGVTVVGACAELTQITPGPSASVPAVAMTGPGASLVDVTVAARRTGISTADAVTLERVLVTDARGTGIRVEGGALTGQRVVVRGTREDASGGGEALFVAAEATVDLERVVLDDNRGGALRATSGTVTLRDAAIADTIADIAGGNGRAIVVETGARVELTRAALEGHREHAATATGSGAALVLRDVVVRDTLGRDSDGLEGRAVAVWGGAEATLERVLVERAAGGGLYVSESTVTLDDVVVRDSELRDVDYANGQGILVDGTAGRAVLRRVRVDRVYFAGVEALRGSLLDAEDLTVRDPLEAPPPSGGAFGVGVWIEGAEADITRLDVSGAVRTGISLLDSATTLADVRISDTRGSDADGNGGESVSVAQGSTLEADRVLLERGHFAGISVTTDAVAHVRDFAVHDIDQPPGFGISGYAAVVWTGGLLDVDRGLFERNRTAGVLIEHEASTFDGEDVVIRDMRGDRSFGLHGWALGASSGGQARLSRALVDRARFVALVVNGIDSYLGGSDLVVRDTLEAECAADLCAETPFGVGVGAYRGGAAELSRFAVANSALINVQLATGGIVDLRAGLVAEAPFGVNVQSIGFDLDRLTADVVYVDNGVNLETSELPVPGLGF